MVLDDAFTSTIATLETKRNPNAKACAIDGVVLACVAEKRRFDYIHGQRHHCCVACARMGLEQSAFRPQIRSDICDAERIDLRNAQPRLFGCKSRRWRDGGAGRNFCRQLGLGILTQPLTGCWRVGNEHRKLIHDLRARINRNITTR